MTPTRILTIGEGSRAVHVHRWSCKRSEWCTGLILRRCGVRRSDHVTPERHGFFMANGIHPRGRPPFKRTGAL